MAEEKLKLSLDEIIKRDADKSKPRRFGLTRWPVMVAGSGEYSSILHFSFAEGKPTPRLYICVIFYVYLI